MALESAVIEPILLSHLDWEDGRFALESHLPADGLHASIARHGLLTPPWVLRTSGDKLAIVDGFKRLRCLHERGEDRAVCAVFPIHTDPRKLWMWRLEARLHGAPPNPAEKARVAAILVSGPFPPDAVRRLLDGFDLPHRPESLQKWLRLSQSDRSLLEAAAVGSIHERAALELAGWPERCQDRTVIMSMLQQLRCSASIQVEIVEGLRDVAAGRRLPVGEILPCPEIRGILEHPDWSHREKTQALRDWLDNARRPRLKARERQLAEQLRRRPLPPRTHLAPPPSFEGSHWRLEIVFFSEEDLRERLGQLKSWSETARLREILTPSRGSATGPHPPDTPSNH
ncbi:MAG: ParB N-terminal domain-containing protein [Syntrophobacteraceae bacterium]|jgi:ParB family chromosome partitioning protein|nr:ParB N-terminal domain-containing protein [Syntrophobacteraceae bacterium]